MTFADVFDLQMGKTPSRDISSYWSGDNVWVSIADMKDRKYVDSSKETISDEAIKATGIREVPEGTVFMSFKLSIGKVAIAAKNLYTNEAIMQFPIKPGYELSPEYLYYYLLGHKWQGANKAVMGATLNKKKIAQEHISFPSIEEQQRIVDELDLLTGIIDKKNAQLRDLDALAQSIFYEMFGDPNANSLNWPSSSFKDIFKLKSGDGLKEKDFVTGQFPVYGGNGISGYHNAFNKEGKHIIIGRVGAYCGNVRVVEDCFWLTDNAFDAFFDSSVLDYYFASWLLNTLVLHRFANHAAQPVISNSGLKDLLIILPPIEIQRHFSERVLAILQQKSSISNSIIDVKMLLSERMDAYFS